MNKVTMDHITWMRDGQVLDEILLTGVDIHLERTSDGSIWMGVSKESDTVLAVNISAVNGTLAMTAEWQNETTDDPQPWPRVQINR